MKRLSVFVLICLTVTACMCLTVSAETADHFEIEIPYVQTPPSIDGIAMGGEYPEASVVMNDHTAEAWVGEMSRESSTIWNFAWDESGLYVFATVRDRTPVYRDESTHWVGADCVEIGLNPGGILDQPDDKGVFFSMGATADGRVIVYRHNYDEKIVSSEVRGCAVGHTQGSSSYTIEVCIPWSLIFIEADCTKTDTHLNATGMVPGECFIMNMVLAAIDAKDDSTIGVAYKFNGTDFVTGQYIPGMLTGERHVETIGSGWADTEPVTYPEAEAQTNAATVSLPETHTQSMTAVSSEETDKLTSDKGCRGLIGGSALLWLLLLFPALILRRKHFNKTKGILL